jgi:hypothetical protein
MRKSFIKLAREAQDIDVDEAAERSGLTRYEFSDLETHEDEFYDVLSLESVRRVCDVLHLDLKALLNSRYLNQGGHAPPDPPSSLEDTIIRQRNALGLTHERLGNLAGIKEDFIRAVENDSGALESWPLDQINFLANALNLPIEVLVISRKGQPV